jgi:hypothetical protein
MVVPMIAPNANSRTKRPATRADARRFDLHDLRSDYDSNKKTSKDIITKIAESRPNPKAAFASTMHNRIKLRHFLAAPIRFRDANLPEIAGQGLCKKTSKADK